MNRNVAIIIMIHTYLTVISNDDLGSWNEHNLNAEMSCRNAKMNFEMIFLGMYLSRQRYLCVHF